MTAAERYADDVLSGRVVTGRLIRLACERFKADLKNEAFVWDVSAATKPINLTEKYLRHWEGSWRGKPIILELWQNFIIQQVFGWKLKSNGRRRVRSAYVQIARKNAKTTKAAVIAIFHLVADDENTPQILVGANNEDQAKICVNCAGRIIENSPELLEVEGDSLKLFKYNEKIHTIAHKERNGLIDAMSKNPETKDGFNPSLGIIDEYHEADNDKLLNVIESGQGARPEPLMFCITTAGFDKSGPCYSKLRKASIEVLEGQSHDESHLAFIYELDEKDQWDDPANWIKANPNLNISVFPEYLEARMKKAKIEGGSKIIDFKTKNLNLWTDAPSVWIADETWMTNQHGIKEEDLIGKDCYAAVYNPPEAINVCLFYFPSINGYHVFKGIAWIPEDNIKNNQETVDYQAWVDTGDLRTASGTRITPNEVADQILKESQNYFVKSFAFDNNSTQSIAPQLEEAGHTIMPISQSFSHLSQQTKEFESLARAGQIEHFGNPIFRYHLKGTVIHTNANGEIKPDKKGSSTKIGFVVAALNAMVAKFETEKDGVMTDFSFK